MEQEEQMATKIGSVAIRKLEGMTIDLEIIITKELRLRIWLATKIMLLAAKIMGVNLSITPKGNQP